MAIATSTFNEAMNIATIMAETKRTADDLVMDLLKESKRLSDRRAGTDMNPTEYERRLQAIYDASNGAATTVEKMLIAIKAGKKRNDGFYTEMNHGAFAILYDRHYGQGRA